MGHVEFTGAIRVTNGKAFKLFDTYLEALSFCGPGSTIQENIQVWTPFKEDMDGDFTDEDVDHYEVARSDGRVMGVPYVDRESATYAAREFDHRYYGLGHSFEVLAVMKAGSVMNEWIDL